jgi:glycosyltransferase involved in cell wall biosynthesis
MNILQISTYDIMGGAPRAAFRLNLALRRLRQNSRMLVQVRHSPDSSITRFIPKANWFHKTKRALREARIFLALYGYRGFNAKGDELFSDARSSLGGELAIPQNSWDLVNLHWVARFVDYKRFFATLPPSLPVVWTLHDMNAFTGGCHYDRGCNRFTGQCGACPMLRSSNGKDLSHRVWREKAAAFGMRHARNLRFVTPSSWLAKHVRSSSLLREFDVEVIGHGLDTAEFCPRDRLNARELLGLSPKSKVVLFVAQWIHERRKGLQHLLQAVAALSSRDVVVVCVGDGETPARAPCPFVHFKHVNAYPSVVTAEGTKPLADRFLSLAYSAADVMVIPSLQENSPQTVLEAMACGIPVIGYDVGGIPDLITDDTGLLVPAGDVQHLAKAIQTVLTNEGTARRMGANARDIVLKEFTLEAHARKYLSFYEKLIGDAQGHDGEPKAKARPAHECAELSV